MQHKQSMLSTFCSGLVMITTLLAHFSSSALASTQVNVRQADVPAQTESNITDDTRQDEHNTVPVALSETEWKGLLDQIDQPASPEQVDTAPSVVPQAYLKASNSDFADFFGHSVAVSGDTIAIGAYGEASSADGINGNQNNESADSAGAVYIFVRSSNGVWTQQVYLKASNSDLADGFGVSLALDGDTLVVGAPGEKSAADGVNANQNDNSAGSAGAAYVFVRSGTGAGAVWSQQAYLKASNSEAGDSFGAAVALDGNTVVVGAPGKTRLSGAAYVFVRSRGAGGTGVDGVWSQQAMITASDGLGVSEEGGDFGDTFGSAVDVSGDTIAVGAPGKERNDGGAYLYERNAGVWSEKAILDFFDRFGSAIALDGDTLAVGEFFRGSGVTVFVRTGTGAAEVWSQQAFLIASNSRPEDSFGTSLVLSGDRLLIGAVGETSAADGVNGNQEDSSAGGAGAAYLFVRSGTGASAVWSQQAYLKASNSEAGDSFGAAVAMSGNTIVVGAAGEASAARGVNGNQTDNTLSGAGAVYTFQIMPEDPSLLLSSTTSGAVGGVSFGDEDILRFNPTSNSWLKYFDGSDVGLSANDVDALIVKDGDLLISLELSATLPGITGTVQPNDLIRFHPTSLGESTRGSFSMFLDASDVSLGSVNEDIDAATFLLDGRLAVSTRVTATVPGLIASDEDWLVLNNGQFGSNTSGTWSLYFDGSDVGLGSPDEDIRGAGVTAAGELMLVTNGNFSVPNPDGTRLTGNGSDVFICQPGTLGTNTTCTFRKFFEGAAHGFGGENIDSFELLNSASTTVTLTSADVGDTAIDDLNADDHTDLPEETGSEEEETMNQQFFLPMMAR